MCAKTCILTLFSGTSYYWRVVKVYISLGHQTAEGLDEAPKGA